MTVLPYRSPAQPRRERTHRDTSWVRFPRVTITGWIGVLSFFVTMAAAVWIRDDLHYIIGDTLARTGNAIYVAASRDPHAGAIGFYWPPLHSLLQIPFVLVLRPFNAIEWAGPLESALALAVTVALIGRLARLLGVGRWAAAGVCLAFAFNPVMVFFGANGMSETTSFLFLLLALDGFVRWSRDDGNGSLTTCSMALAGLVLVRVEAVLLVAVLVFVGAWSGRHLRRATSTALLIGLPATFTFVMWMVVQQVLLNDGLFFLHTNLAPATTTRDWLPDPADRPGILRWTVSWILIFAPLLLVTFAVLLARFRPGTPWHRSSEARIVVGLWGAALVFPAFHALLLTRNATTGNPRYFLAGTVVEAVAVLWAASPRRSRPLGKAWNILLVTGLALSGVVSMVALRDPVRTKVEQENYVFDMLVGKDRRPELDSKASEWAAFRALAKDVDRIVPTSAVLADNTYAFPLLVFSEKRTSFVIPNDRDFEPILADPEGKVDFIVQADEGYLRYRFGGRFEDPVGDIVKAAPTRWETRRVPRRRVPVPVEGRAARRPGHRRAATLTICVSSWRTGGLGPR